MSFQPLLADLLARIPFARGAVLCDFEGEFIDLAIAEPQPSGCGPLSPYEMKLHGAQIAPTWMLFQNGDLLRGAGAVLELRMTCPGGTLLCQGLREGYYLVLLLAPGARRAAAAFALKEAAARALAEL